MDLEWGEKRKSHRSTDKLRGNSGGKGSGVNSFFGSSLDLPSLASNSELTSSVSGLLGNNSADIGIYDCNDLDISVVTDVDSLDINDNSNTNNANHNDSTASSIAGNNTSNISIVTSIVGTHNIAGSILPVPGHGHVNENSNNVSSNKSFRSASSLLSSPVKSSKNSTTQSNSTKPSFRASNICGGVRPVRIVEVTKSKVADIFGTEMAFDEKPTRYHSKQSFNLAKFMTMSAERGDFTCNIRYQCMIIH